MGHGAGTAGRAAGGADGGLGGAAALAGACLLRSAAGGAGRGWVRRLRRAAVCTVLRQQAGPAVVAAGPLLPDPSGRLLRGDRQRARPGMAVRRQPVPARVPAAGFERAGARPFLAEQDARAAAAGGPRSDLHLGAAALGRARPDPGRPDRRRRLDDGGQCGAARDRPPRQRRRLSRDAAATGQGKRHRDADGG